MANYDQARTGTVYDMLLAAQNQLAVTSMPQVKPMESNKAFYRFRPGEYRLGYYFKEKVLHLSRILHRKEMYRFFPPE